MPSGTQAHERPPAMPADAFWVFDGDVYVGAQRICVGAELETALTRVFTEPRQAELMRAVAQLSRDGDNATANIRLALAGMQRVTALHLHRLEGSSDNRLGKYDSDQPRIPAGSGPESGRWASGPSGGSASTGPKPSVMATTAAIAVARAAGVAPSLIGESLAAERLLALSTFAASLGGAAAVFGTLFVPSPNSTSTRGPIPGGDDLSYEYDRDEGVLRLRDGSGAIIAGGPRDPAGMFHDADTGVAIGRDIGGALVFDQAAMVAAAGAVGAIPRASADAQANELDQEPRLCPEPTPESDNRPSNRAKAYQEQISALVNPQRPLPYGLAMAFFNPTTERWVRADECDETDGAVIEAKGPGFAKNLKYDLFQESYEAAFVDQAERESQAAGIRPVRWYFAEQETADFALNVFLKAGLSNRIQVIHVEAKVR